MILQVSVRKDGILVDILVEVEYNIGKPDRFPCGDTLKLYSGWGG